MKEAAIAHPIEERFGPGRVEGAAFTAFGHHPGGLLRRHPAQTDLLDHLPDQVEGNHPVTAHGVEFHDFPLRQAVPRSPDAEGVFGAVAGDPRPPAALLNLIQETADVDAEAEVGPDQFLDDLLKGVDIGEDGSRHRAVFHRREEAFKPDIVMENAPLFDVAPPWCR